VRNGVNITWNDAIDGALAVKYWGVLPQWLEVAELVRMKDYVLCILTTNTSCTKTTVTFSGLSLNFFWSATTDRTSTSTY
jgi:hypothetical protein